MNEYILIVGGAVIITTAVGAFWTWRRLAKSKAAPQKPSSDTKGSIEPSEGLETSPVLPAPTLAEKLGKTRQSILGRLGTILSASGKNQFTQQEWETLEEGLLEADVGVHTTTEVLDRVRERVKGANGSSLRSLICAECEEILEGVTRDVGRDAEPPKPFVINIVGVNGVGKTTTIAKIANHFKKQGQSVLFGAADTFRAAAISQLKVWAQRVGAQFVAGREGGDPGAVVYDSLSAGKARGVDVVMLDTAGRLHTKTDLMDELKKIERVAKKVIPEAPHETWLILDGTIGQNSIQQAREFQKVLDITGVIVTKLDGTARGGAVLGIASELKLPIRYIGVGESLEDLIPFESKAFVEAILG